MSNGSINYITDVNWVDLNCIALDDTTGRSMRAGNFKRLPLRVRIDFIQLHSFIQLTSLAACPFWIDSRPLLPKPIQLDWIRFNSIRFNSIGFGVVNGSE